MGQLWSINAQAWRIYQTLCGRTVGLAHLQGYVFERLTETWPTEQVLDMVKRIDCLLDMLSPQEHGQ